MRVLYFSSFVSAIETFHAFNGLSNLKCVLNFMAWFNPFCLRATFSSCCFMRVQLFDITCCEHSATHQVHKGKKLVCGNLLLRNHCDIMQSHLATFAAILLITAAQYQVFYAIMDCKGSEASYCGVKRCLTTSAFEQQLAMFGSSGLCVPGE